MADANQEEKFTPKGENEIRQEVTEEFNFDAEADKERIDKLTKERLDNQEKLSTAIKQKQTRREQAEKHAAKLRELGFDPETGKKLDEGEKKVDDKGESEIAKRLVETQKQLDEVMLNQAGEFSDAVKKDIRDYAKLNGISYKEAAKSDFIKFQIQQEETKKKNEDAALGGGGGGEGAGSRKVDAAKPQDLKNLSDEEYAKWKEKHLK